MNSVTPAQRLIEKAKYVSAYKGSKYKISHKRFAPTAEIIDSLPAFRSLLDVSCGRGEIIDYAVSKGAFARGTEIVPVLCERPDVVFGWAHDLPFLDNTFDVVTMFDVMEHLLVGDDEAACREMGRVAVRTVLISVCPHADRVGGGQYHVNLRPNEVWGELFRDWFPGATVTRFLPSMERKQSFWRIDL